MPAAPSAPPTLRTIKLGFLVFLVTIVELGMLILLPLTTRWQEITPTYDDFHLMCWVGAGIAILCLVAMLAMKPRTFKSFFQILAITVLLGFLGCLATKLAADRVHEIADFSHAGVIERVREFKIRSASIARGKSISYSVALAGYPALLAVDEPEYRRAFGAEEKVQPSDYCVRVRAQNTDRAIRIRLGAFGKLPAGSLIPCSHPGAPAPRPEPFASSLFKAPPTAAREAESWSQVARGQRNPLSLPRKLPK